MEIEIEDTVIRAPFEGVLDSRAVEIGDFLEIGDPVATVVDLDPCLIVAQVSERDIGAVELGAPGTAELVTGQTVAGSIRYVSRVSDPVTRTFRVELEVPNPAREIVHGVTAELHLPIAETRAHFVSPAVLTLADDGTIGVKSVDETDTVRFRPVEIVRDTAEGVWLGGLPERFRLIIVGQEFVHDGMQVKPLPEAGLAATEDGA